ncbi:MAG TPA: signal peptidase II [Dehalococcoidales bacterium]|nr:signal peptidase II [Dehalococcoidales bacterium]
MPKFASVLKDKRSLIILLIVFVHVALDQATKAWIRTYPINSEIGHFGFVRIIHIQNTGAGFGMFYGYWIPLLIVGVLGLSVLVWFYYWIHGKFPQYINAWTIIAYSLIVGGTIGNLIDRIWQSGAVTDFIDPRIWPVFNIADAGISVGGVMFVIFIIWLASKEKQQGR